MISIPFKTHRILIMVALLAQPIIYALLWVNMIQDPAQRTGTDFIAFYTAGKAANQWGPDQAYDTSNQHNIQQKEVGFALQPNQILLYNHLPFLIPILQLLASADYSTAFSAWALFLLTLYGLALYLLWKSLAWESPQNRWILFLGALEFYPLFASILNGQDSAFLVLGTACCLYFLNKNQDFLAGIGLSLATVRPHIIIILALPFLLKRQKVFAGAILGSGILALFSLLLIGPHGAAQFIEILKISAGGEWHGMQENAMFNLIGSLTRTIPTPSVDQIRLIGWGVYLAFLLILGIYTYRRPSLDANILGLAISFGLFFLPHLHYHDLALLLIPIFLVIKKTRWASLAVLLSIILLMGFTPFLRYWVTTVLMAGLGLWFLRANQEQEQSA